MAESASAAATSGGPGAKSSSSSSSGAWWKSLATRKKSTKEGPVGAAAPPAPAWPPTEPSTEMLPPALSRASDSPENLGSGSGSRRNLKISRSGRFKEKRKVRTALLPESPQKLFESGGAVGSPGLGSATAAAAPSEKTPCQ